MLKYSDRCMKALPKRPLFTTRRGKNLRDILINAKIPKGSYIADKPPVCKTKNCSICPNVKQKDLISSVTLQNFNAAKNCTCQTKNVIYLLTCSICQKQYVGETKRAFCVRYKEHSKDIEFNQDKPIVHHVLSHKELEAKIIPQIIEVVKRDPDLESTTAFRRQREAHWIYSLRTLAPEGLNTLG